MQRLLISTAVLVALEMVSGMLRHPLSHNSPQGPAAGLPAEVIGPRLAYGNDWAIEVHGGVEMANLLAAKHGFLNLGQVLDNVTNIFYRDVLLQKLLVDVYS